jgi:hypothetical protein
VCDHAALSNNPRKLVGIEGYGCQYPSGFSESRAGFDTPVSEDKKDKLGHKLSSV